MPFNASFFRLPAVRHTLVKLAELRVDEKLDELTRYLPNMGSVLDIGTGNGVLCSALRKRGYDVTPLDIANFSFFDDVVPITYDGLHIPFENDRFELALLITVLHHTPAPERVLEEAKRVAKRVVVIEEVVTGTINRMLTYSIDSLFNCEFIGHPHTNKTDMGWKRTFSELELTLVDVRHSKSTFLLNRVTYVLAKQNCNPVNH